MSLPICKFYSANKSCKFGKNCHFLHSQRPPSIKLKENLLKNENHEDPIEDRESVSDKPINSSKQDEESVNQDQVQIVHISENSKALCTELEHSEPEKVLSSKERPKDKSQNDQQICAYFARSGKCFYGKRCKFSHVLQRGPPQRRQQQGNNLGRNNKSQRNNENSRKSEQGFKNETDSKTQSDTDDHLKDSSVLSEAERKAYNGNPQTLAPDDKDNKRKTDTRICKFFKSNGGCKRGERCRFFHPDDMLNDLSLVDDTRLRKLDKDKIKTCYDKVYAGISRRRVARPGLQSVLTLLEVETVGITKLRQQEINSILRRFPKDKITTVDDDENKFSVRIKFSPTDPDWPFDVKVFDLLVSLPRSYPKDMLKVNLPRDQDLPETVRRFVDVTIGEWLDEKKKYLDSVGKVELVFRTFLRWLDRNIEDITTEALKQLKRDLTLKAAGMEILTPQQLRAKFRGNSESSEDVDEALGDEDDDSDSEAELEDESEEEVSSEGEESVEPQNVINLDPEKKGTEIELRHLQLKENASAVFFEKLKLVVQCGRCKNHADLRVQQGKVMSLSCEKCNQSQFVHYRPALIHQFSSTLGYLDVDGCQAFDLILQDSTAMVTCFGCSKQTKVEGLATGYLFDGWCRACNAKFKLAIESVKFSQLVPSGVDTSVSKVVEVAPAMSRKPPKDPAIREGCPLPEFGTCKHYKHSYRWLRFPCCGKAYPCDVCHDKKEDHEMTFANRMICGHCCKEQNFSASRPCSACSQHMTKTRSAFWEGGFGCRDKIAMSRNESQKYKNQHKTISNKKKTLVSGAKKNIKLRHV